MAGVENRVIDTSQEEHREVSDTLLALSDAIESEDLELARELVPQANEQTGPRFQYVEDAPYPALVRFFGEDVGKELVKEHDEALEATARRGVIGSCSLGSTGYHGLRSNRIQDE